MNDDDPTPAAALEEGEARRRLAQLRVEHEDLDASVQALEAIGHLDQIRIARLKKKKLSLRDEMARLEDVLTPDIIAWTPRRRAAQPRLRAPLARYMAASASASSSAAAREGSRARTP